MRPIAAIHAVTVFCSSSDQVAPAFGHAASQLGRAIAAQEWKLVYGGNSIGMMKLLADGCREAGGEVVGVTPKLFVDQNCHDERCAELIITDTIRQRKQIMEARGDAFISLPGGLGTLEEFFEILAGKQLRCHDKPIVLLNIDGFYDPLLAMIEHGLKHRFIRPRARELFHTSSGVDNAIDYLLSGRGHGRGRDAAGAPQRV